MQSCQSPKNEDIGLKFCKFISIIIWNKSCFGGFDISWTQKELFRSYTMGSKISVFASMTVLKFMDRAQTQKWRYWAEILYVRFCWPYLQIILLPYFKISSDKKVLIFCVSLPVQFEEVLGIFKSLYILQSFQFS